MSERTSELPYAGTVKRPLISIIVARASNGVIGKEGGLPWHLSGDLKRFKALTMGHPIIMGRKTWDSIGRPLPGRRNIIVTRRPDYIAPGSTVVDSLDSALAACLGEDEVFVIGGAQLYAQALPLARRIYLTEVEGDYAGDTSFPAFDTYLWRETNRITTSDAASGVSVSYLTLEHV